MDSPKGSKKWGFKGKPQAFCRLVLPHKFLIKGGLSERIKVTYFSVRLPGKNNKVRSSIGFQ